jgi:nitrogen regulatory protein P-II 1
MTKEIIVLTDLALITCIVQRGMGDEVARAAQEAGAQGATIHYARGSGVRERLGILGLAVNVEKEVIDIIVAADQIDRVFDSMHEAGKLDTPGMGFMYVTPLEKAATFIPPEMASKLTGGK